MKKLLIPIFLMLVLTGLVSALTLSVSGDTTVDENETMELDLIATYGGNETLDFTVSPTLGAITPIDNLTAEFVWITGFDDAGTYDVTFSVTDGNETASVNKTLTVTNVNRAPSISGATLNIDSGEDSITYSVVASDPDTGDTLNYTLVSENASQVDCSVSATGVLTAARVGDWFGDGATCVVKVEDNHGATAQATFTIDVDRESKLSITNVEVIFNEGDDDEDDKDYDDGDTVEAENGETLTFIVDVKNLFDKNDPNEDDMDIEDIVVTIEIEKFDNDDDDEDQESDEFNLDPGEKDDVTLEFGEIDDELDGTYDITIEAVGDDVDGNEHKTTWELTLDVDKPRDKVEIISIDYQETLNCGQESFELEVKLKNTGKDDQDELVLYVKSNDFDYNKRLRELEIKDGKTLTKTFEIPVPSNKAPGNSYFVSVFLYMDDDDYSDEEKEDQQTVVVRIPDCSGISDDDEEEDEEDETDDDDGFELVTGDVTGATGSFVGQTTDKDGLFEGTMGITLIVLLYILIIVIIVVLLMKAFKN